MNEPRKRFEDLSLYKTWDDDYYRTNFDSFYDDIIEYFIDETGINAGDTVLEAGCGPCIHTIRLARRGFQCTSIDFSATALEEGKKRLKREGLLDKATLRQEDITSLSFPDNSFPFIFCWGVIMHIPEPEKAIRELARVLMPGGFLAISSNNAHSLDNFLMEKIAYKIKRPRTLRKIGTSDMGRYAVFRPHDDDLFVQAIFPKKLAARFADFGLRVQSCAGVQFTELYTKFQSKFVRRLFSAWNRFWFRRVRLPHLCVSHFLILNKDK